MWHDQTALGRNQRAALRKIGPLARAERFYLAGGTAIALQLGHRRSVDLDWFTGEELEDPNELAVSLRSAGANLSEVTTGTGSLHARASGVRVSFLRARFKQLAPLLKWPEYGCEVASLDDLAAFKLGAIAQRAARKDFVDIYALGKEHRPLKDLITLYTQKYELADSAHLIHSLSYFDHAD